MHISPTRKKLTCWIIKYNIKYISCYCTDVQKSLDKQVEEISALRAQMLGEYEQMLSVRAEVMASQSQEVEKLQQEMAQIQKQYEEQMAEFETKVQSQTG